MQLSDGEPRMRRVVVAWLAMTLVALGAFVVPDASRGAEPRGAVLPVGKGTDAVWGGGAPVVADGRIWQIVGSINPFAQNLSLQSAPLRGDGEERGQLLAQMSPRLDVSVANEYPNEFPHEFVTSFGVAGGRAYVRAALCSSDGPPRYCTAPENRAFVFDTESGGLLQAYPWNSGPLPKPLQPGMLLFSSSEDRSTFAIEDPVTGERFGPRPAAEAQWTYSGAAALRTQESGKHVTYDVLDYRTGDVRYSVSEQALLRAAMQPLADVDGVGLQADGSLAVWIKPQLSWSARRERQYRRGPVPVYVDPGGRVRRAGPRMKGAVEVSAVPAGDRVIVSSESGTRGRGQARRAVCTGAWVVDRSGKRGYALSTERGAGRLRVAGAPVFWDGTTGIWSRDGSGKRKASYIVRQLDGLRLRASQRPSCAGGSRSARLSSEFDR